MRCDSSSIEPCLLLDCLDSFAYTSVELPGLVGSADSPATGEGDEGELGINHTI